MNREEAVLFPGMKGGEHLKSGEAQLTDVELSLYKNQALYKLPVEQAAITKLSGEVLDTATMGELTSTYPMSQEFLNKYGYWKADMFSEGNFGEEHIDTMTTGKMGSSLYQTLSGSVMMHTHPSYEYMYSKRTPKAISNVLSETLGRVPSWGDIANNIKWKAEQNIIINKAGVTVVSLPSEIRSMMLDERIKSLGSTSDMFNTVDKETEKIVDPFWSNKKTGDMALSERIERAQKYGNEELA